MPFDSVLSLANAALAKWPSRSPNPIQMEPIGDTKTGVVKWMSECRLSPLVWCPKCCPLVAVQKLTAGGLLPPRRRRERRAFCIAKHFCKCRFLGTIHWPILYLSFLLLRQAKTVPTGAAALIKFCRLPPVLLPLCHWVNWHFPPIPPTPLQMGSSAAAHVALHNYNQLLRSAAPNRPSSFLPMAPELISLTKSGRQSITLQTDQPMRKMTTTTTHTQQSAGMKPWISIFIDVFGLKVNENMLLHITFSPEFSHIFGCCFCKFKNISKLYCGSWNGSRGQLALPKVEANNWPMDRGKADNGGADQGEFVWWRKRQAKSTSRRLLQSRQNLICCRPLGCCFTIVFAPKFLVQ